MHQHEKHIISLKLTRKEEDMFLSKRQRELRKKRKKQRVESIKRSIMREANKQEEEKAARLIQELDEAYQQSLQQDIDA